MSNKPIKGPKVRHVKAQAVRPVETVNDSISKACKAGVYYIDTEPIHQICSIHAGLSDLQFPLYLLFTGLTPCAATCRPYRSTVTNNI